MRAKHLRDNALLRHHTWAATVCVAIAGLIFCLVKPAVRDSWAALARGHAVSEGVGLGYWFSWYAGAHPPGGYSVIVPYLSSIVGAYVVVALAASAIPWCVAYATYRTAHPIAAVWVAAVSASLNMWSGRVTFVAGAALATLGMGFAVHKRPRRATLAVILAGLASPVAVAFVLVGLGAGFLVRRVSWKPILGGLVFMAASVVLWGSSGPQGFGWASAIFALLLCALYLVANPVKPVKYAIGITALAIVVVASVPNALGMNLARLVFAVLPVAVAATAYAPRRAVAVAIIPPLAWLGYFTVDDVRDASAETSSLVTYDALAAELRKQPDIGRTRVEVVADGTQTAAYVLGGEFWLGRGWETQADRKLSDAFVDSEVELNPRDFTQWLNEASIGYVAINKHPVKRTGEWQLVANRRPASWQPIWENEQWKLYRVPGVQPMVSPGGTLIERGADHATIRAQRPGSFVVRVAWSSYLIATNEQGERVPVYLTRTKDDWTKVHVPGPITFQLRSRF